MLAPITSVKVGIPDGWIGWDGGQAHEQVDSLTADVTDPTTRDALRQLILDTDTKATATGLVTAVALWVPDANPRTAQAVMRAELRTGDPAQPLSHEALLHARTNDPLWGYHVTDRSVIALGVPAGPAVAEVTILAQRRGFLGRRLAPPQARILYSVTPPGSYDVAELELVTHDPQLLDALVEQARTIAASLQVRLGEPD